MMAILTLEDLYGSTEVLAFPKVYERLKDKLIEDTVVLLTGRLSAREDETPKLILDGVTPLLTDAENKAKAPSKETGAAFSKLYLKLSRSQLDAVEFILETTPGAIPVYYYFADEKKTFIAPEHVFVSASYDRDGLVSLLGEGSVVTK